MQEVPGIGNAAVAKLAEGPNPDHCITNTYQLFGHYIKLRGPDNEGEPPVSVTETNHKMWYFLKNKGIASHRSAIVKALNEKTGTFFPGFQAVDDDDSDDESQ